jgi:uncharacterized protein YbjT (DUF2867 family)
MRPESPRHAVLLGATGAVGSALLSELLGAPGWDTVVLIGRRAPDEFLGRLTPPERARVRSHVVSMAALEAATERVLRADGGADGWAAFCTLGIGQPRKVSRDEVWRVDVGYAGAFARGGRAAGVSHATLLSSVAADPASRSYYLRVKGSAEAAVVSAGIPRVSLFRPSLLVTREVRYGLQDRVSRWAMPRLSRFLPSRFHEIRVEDLARAMRLNAERPRAAAVEVLHYGEMAALLSGAG